MIRTIAVQGSLCKISARVLNEFVSGVWRRVKPYTLGIKLHHCVHLPAFIMELLLVGSYLVYAGGSYAHENDF